MILKLAPLFLKNIVMKLIFNAVGEKTSCFTMSNLGVVNLPDAMARGLALRVPNGKSALAQGLVDLR